mgnify:CR=1 FL=1
MNERLIELNRNQNVSEVDTYTTKRYTQFYKYIKNNHNKILDFGCNTGRGGKVLKFLKEDLFLIGADVVKERIDKIPLGIYNELIDLSVDEISNKLKEIDVIVSGEVVEHIPFALLISYLKYFYEILPKNGILMLTTPNPDSFLVKMGRNSVLSDPSHVNIMNRGFLKIILLKLGFKKILIRGSGKATTYFGVNFPVFNVYGSYLVLAYK